MNLMGNFSQDLALKVLERENRLMSAFDRAPFIQGASRESLNLHSQTVQAISVEYFRKRLHSKRKSGVGGPRAAPGVPWDGFRSKLRAPRPRRAAPV